MKRKYLILIFSVVLVLLLFFIAKDVGLKGDKIDVDKMSVNEEQSPQQFKRVDIGNDIKHDSEKQPDHESIKTDLNSEQHSEIQQDLELVL